ncbi:MAG: 16S rRNA (adenine(1518)-N(6)/adenine(1519)-N(6))-dimethyltransferase RsmA [Gammaproteobacteria bacterium]|nr:16S rRNA (adenine(1518)-N(6)/adenine(1519)-N(6))-dimethyltransferase RsmA [Gammaproteobacteria bacterium]
MAAHRARKRFGQHFLTDPGVIDAIVRAIHPAKDDVIVEIGPGRGAITDKLARRAGHLHAVELDRDLAALLRKRFSADANVTIHEADALLFDFGELGPQLRIVGNLPYNISTPLLFHLLKFRERILDMHFMLQKEVVERISAVPGSKAYGRLGIMLGCHLQAETLFDVDRLAFTPPPAVTSAVVRLDPLPAGTFAIDRPPHLSLLVTTAFMQRRKTLRNALKKLATNEDFAAVGIDAGLRPEQIPIDQYVALSNHLGKKT